ncbi:Excision repair cross-complementing rodent repair deficiency, complementation group 5 [Aphanomyces cochlioides]|nr:Excision repair cross-complementing rodent repair deficiency, complementation group 5 [Aphanomyces cochlioides]
MGVHGLWMLLAAGGRQVSMESLSGQILAVDASIWLTQFVKAMRDPEDGSMLRNAHLLGTFHRVSKLLYYGIRPVFVFDGDTPAIKLRTLQQRRSRREKSQLSLTQTAQRLLLKQLKDKSAKAKNAEPRAPAAPPAPEAVEIDEFSEEEKEEAEDSDEDRNMRFDIEHYENFQREQRQEAREKFLALAGKPEEYSLVQIRTFLKSSQLNREMKARNSAQDAPESGRRIASEEEKRYIYIKESAPTSRESAPARMSNPNDRVLDDSESSIGLFSAYVQAQAEKMTEAPANRRAWVPLTAPKSLEESPKVETKPAGNFLSKKPKPDVSWTQESDGNFSITFDPSKVQLTEQEMDILPPAAFMITQEPLDDVKLEEETSEKHEEARDNASQENDSDMVWENVDLNENKHPSPAENTEAKPEVPSAQTEEESEIPDADYSEKITEEGSVHEEDEGFGKEFDDQGSEFEWGDEEKEEEAHHAEETKEDEDVPLIEEKKQANEATVDLTESPEEEIFVVDNFEDQVIKDIQDEEELEILENLTLDGMNADALQSVMTTASNLTQWAAGAVKRAILHHQQKQNTSSSMKNSVASANDVVMSEDSMPRYLPRIQPPKETPAPPERAQNEDISRQEFDFPLESEDELKRYRNQQMRDVDGVTDEMKSQVMDLLRLFGVPFLVCPMEAEAQCATLEQLGLVQGVITDDSDIFAFGGRKVYKNMFKDSKFVEAFFADDIERELGLNQDSMIALALLLGSDYTDGINGIGIVNATEIVHAFDGLEGLERFKEWVNDFNIQEQIKPQKKLSEAEISELEPLERFKHTHHTIRRHWTISNVFPNPHVIKAYKNPETDRSTARFTWSVPDLASLRVFCGNAFGWPMEKINTTLLPVVQAASRGCQTQTRIDSYFTSYNDNVKYAKIQSKRLKAVVKEIQGSNKKKRTKE